MRVPRVIGRRNCIAVVASRKRRGCTLRCGPSAASRAQRLVRRSSRSEGGSNPSCRKWSRRLLRCARNDDWMCVRVLAARCARSLKIITPINERAQGRPGARCTRGLVCEVHKGKCTRAYRFSGEHPAFPAQWLYGLYVISPVSHALLPPLTPDSGRQNHTTSPYASVASSWQHQRPPHPAARS